MRTYGGMPVWVRVALPALAFLMLVVGGIAMAGEDGDESAHVPSTTIEPTAATSAPTTTTNPPTTTTTNPPTTTTTTLAPTTTAPPPPPTTTTVPIWEQNTATRPDGPPPGCHPSYMGCVPIYEGSHCEGQPGEGPTYWESTQVIGPDEYGFDRNGDGVGCGPGDWSQ